MTPARTLHRRISSAPAALLVMAMGLMLSSCSKTSLPVKALTPVAGAAFRGLVHGGQQPVKNSTIQIYAVGTTGDGSASTALLVPAAATDNFGNFNVTGLYTCPSADALVYIVSTGGDPGFGKNNPNLAEMAALGACGNLNANTFITINEVSTVAAVFELAPYMNAYNRIGYGTDLAGITSAFAEVNVLVSLGTGEAGSNNVPAGLAVPIAAINTLADIVAACVNSTGGSAGDGSICGKLMTYAGLTGPADTIAALLQIARNPSMNMAGLYSLISPNSPFQPVLTAAPATWSIELLPVVATPVISPDGGQSDLAQTVTITDATAGATIYYTLDGSTPTTSSYQYGGPIDVAKSTTVKAFGGMSGHFPSAVVSKSYDIAVTAKISTGVMSRYAGTGAAGITGDGGQALAATLNPSHVATDQLGNVYFTDGVSAVLRKITAAGVISKVAGTGTAGASGDGGLAVDAQIGIGGSVAVDPAGDIFVADGAYVREITPDGKISSVDGPGSSSCGGTGSWCGATGIAADGSGNVYVSEVGTALIRKISGGAVTTVAGAGVATATSDAAVAATFQSPTALAVDTLGNVYVVDSAANLVREITTDGKIKTIAGNGSRSTSGDGGPATSAGVRSPVSVVSAADGSVYISGINNATGYIRKVDAGGTISTVSGNGASLFSSDGVDASQVLIPSAVLLALDPSDNLIFSDFTSNRLLKITFTSVSTPVAPVITPATGSYTDTVLVTMSSATRGAVMHYTTDGSTPTVSSPVFPGSLSISSTETVHAIATKSGLTDSAVSTAAYTVNLTVQPPSFSLPGGVYGNVVELSLSDSTAGAAIHYTLDGNDPTESSPVYTGPIELSSSMTVEAIGTKTGYASSSVAMRSFTLVTASPVFSIPAGRYFSPFTLMMTSPTPGASIYYTTDGTTPTVASTPYTGPITVSGNETVTAIAAYAAFNASIPTQAVYAVGAAVPQAGILTTLVGDDAGTYGTPLSVATDLSGNVYFGSDDRHIYKIDPAGVVTIVAGNGTDGFAGDGGQATAAQVSYPLGIVVDPAGVVYYSDFGAHRVRKIGLDGVISRVAGTGDQNFYGDGGQAINAALNWPWGLALDAAGNLYIADWNNGRVRKVTPAGIISSVAGNVGFYAGGPQNLPIGPPTDGVPATQSTLWGPTGVAFDAAGNWYIGEAGYNNVRKVNTSGIISTLSVSPYYYAGGGTYEGDADAVATDPSGNVIVADMQSNRVRKVAPDGTSTTLVGIGTLGGSHVAGAAGYSGDGDLAVNALVSGPQSVATDQAGNIYLADSGNKRIRKITVGPSVPVAGTPYFSVPSGSFTSTQTISMSSVTTGASIFYTLDGSTPTTASTLYSAPIQVARTTTIKAIAVMSGFTTSAVGVDAITIRALAPVIGYLTGTYTTALSVPIASTQSGAEIHYTTDGSLPTAASPMYVAPIAATATTTIRAIAFLSGYAQSDVSTAVLTINYPAPTPTFSPAGGTFLGSVAVSLNDSMPGSKIYYTTDGTNPTTTSRMYTAPFTLSASTTVYAIAVADGYSSSAPATAYFTIQLLAPTISIPGGTYTTFLQSVAISSPVSGATIFYSTDGSTPSFEYAGPFKVLQNQTVKALATARGFASSAVATATYVISAGTIDTVAGNGTAVYNGEGAATSSAIYNPTHAAFDSAGNMYIAEMYGQRVRKVTPAGVISTVAGNGTQGFSGDNGPATSARLSLPKGVAVDSAGNLYIADGAGIRKVDTGGTITTIASGSPTSVAVDSSGNLYFPDNGLNRVRKLSTAGVLSTIAGNGSTAYPGDGGSDHFNGDGAALSVALDLDCFVAPASGIAVDRNNNVYFADSCASRIRRITNGIVTTVAGHAGCSGNIDDRGDGGPATSALLCIPDDVAVDSAGNLYIADTNTGLIRKVDTSGTITSIVGAAPGTGIGDGGSSNTARVSSPAGVAVDNSGNLIIVDSGNNRIRKITFSH